MKIHEMFLFEYQERQKMLKFRAIIIITYQIESAFVWFHINEGKYGAAAFMAMSALLLLKIYGSGKVNEYFRR